MGFITKRSGAAASGAFLAPASAFAAAGAFLPLAGFFSCAQSGKQARLNMRAQPKAIVNAIRMILLRGRTGHQSYSLAIGAGESNVAALDLPEQARPKPA